MNQANTRNKIQKLMASTPFNVLMVSAVLFSVFGWDITRGWLNPAVDSVIETGMVICFGLFLIELVFFIVANKKWYASPIFWIYFIATVSMVFDVHSFVTRISGSQLIMHSAASLRLLKVLRIMTRLGRLIRILKNFALGWIKGIVDKMFNRNQDKASVVQIKKIREKISESVSSPGWTKMEVTITSAILIAFFLIFLPVNIYLDRPLPTLPIEKTFDYIIDYDGPLSGEKLEAFTEFFPETLSIALENETIYRRLSDESLRMEEIRVHSFHGNTLTLDVSPAIRRNARIMTWINLLMVLFSSILTVFIDWVVSKYSLEISGTLKTLAHALDERDSYTRMHSRHVASYAVAVARYLGMKGKEIDVIRLAGELHDIGKIGVPEAILHKPGRLEDDEYSIMKRHTEQGARILDPLINLDQVILAVYHHHEKFDGTGYPEKISGYDIPRIARILSVCDVWDALTTDRPYRKALPFEKAKEIVEMAKGTDFCPDMVDAFFTSQAWKYREASPPRAK